MISEQGKLLEQTKTLDEPCASCPGAIHDRSQGEWVAIMLNPVKTSVNR